MITEKILDQYLRMQRQLNYKINKMFSSSLDVTFSQWRVMAYLEKYGTSTLVEISNYLSIEKPSVTRTIARLEEKNLVEQVAAKDKREKRVQLTDSGKETYTDCFKALYNLELQLLDGASDEEQSMLLQLLSRIKDNLNKVTE